MWIRHRFLLLLVLSTRLVWPACLAAQDQGSPQETPAGTSSRKASKKQAEKLARELGSAYGSWLRDERRAFLTLSTNEEREQFIEIFWNRRNSDPDSPTNTAREEHYRRLAYADERFASGIP